MKCDDCKHAQWKRNSLGSLHPDKSGTCTYEKRVRPPMSFNSWAFTRLIEGDALVIKGGWIERGVVHHKACPVYERKK